ncbi:MAG: phytanoyl-CoA dioxygenase family protein [Proteobacteria bacterium]|nr:phytanoyl-CoA dioxygenase family protein [Pseudomonadota bacterium]
MNPEPLSKIVAADLRAYEKDGVVCLRAMFDLGWIDFLGEAVEQAMLHPGPHGESYTKPGNPGRFFGDLDMWQRRGEFRRFVFESPAAAIAAEIMGTSRVNFFYDQLLVKEPGTVERTPWHQDQPYWAVSGVQICSIWLPLDPVAKENGVEYVRGSHNWHRTFLPYHFTDGSPYLERALERMPDIDAGREAYDIVSFDMEPGDCLVFQAMIVHGAPGNASLARRRRALATRWTGDDARYCVHEGEVAIPTSDPGLKHGDVMDCALFPRVWPRPPAAPG